jgi:dephospho-CoA kinase
MLVGLTGQMGAGKTTLARHLRDYGARIVDADQLGHEMLQRPGVKANLVQAFGPQVIGADGTVDRHRLAHHAFADAIGVCLLNKIVGEPLNEELWKRVEADRSTRDAVVVVDAALLVEWGLHERFDAVVVVVVDQQEAVLERLETNRGLSRDEILKRLNSQGSVEAKLAVADFVIHNNSDLGALHKRAYSLWQNLEKLRLKMPTKSASSSVNPGQSDA